MRHPLRLRDMAAALRAIKGAAPAVPVPLARPLLLFWSLLSPTGVPGSAEGL